MHRDAFMSRGANWMYQLELLVTHTSRPALIKQLLDLQDEGDRVVRELIRTVERNLGVDRPPPKASMVSLDLPESTFLRTGLDRYHASVLLALFETGPATGPQGDSYIEHLVQVYEIYLQLMQSHDGVPHISFERYVSVVRGQEHLTFTNCNNCGSTHVRRKVDSTDSVRECPFCLLHKNQKYLGQDMVTKHVQHTRAAAGRQQQAKNLMNGLNTADTARFVQTQVGKTAEKSLHAISAVLDHSALEDPHSANADCWNSEARDTRRRGT